MKKLVVLLVIVGVGWLFREPLGNLVDQVKALGPRFKTEMDMRAYEDDLLEYIEREGQPPGNVEGWLDENFPPKGPGQPSSQDRYGTAYRVERDRELGVYVLRSCGPDRTCHTEDDLTLELRTGR